MFSMQIAKALGAKVTTTCSSRNLEFVTKTLGADCAIDYNVEVSVLNFMLHGYFYFGRYIAGLASGWGHLK